MTHSSYKYSYFPTGIAWLQHICTYMYNTSAQVCSYHRSIIIATVVVLILQEPALAEKQRHIHASIGRVTGEDNKMEDTASWKNHLYNNLLEADPGAV